MAFIFSEPSSAVSFQLSSSALDFHILRNIVSELIEVCRESREERQDTGHVGHMLSLPLGCFLSVPALPLSTDAPEVCITCLRDLGSSTSKVRTTTVKGRADQRAFAVYPLPSALAFHPADCGVLCTHPEPLPPSPPPQLLSPSNPAPIPVMRSLFCCCLM